MSYWKTRLTHVFIPMTEIALKSARRLLILCLLLCPQTPSKVDFYKMPIVSSVPTQHCTNITQVLQTSFVDAYVQTSRNFWSLCSVAVWACTSLSDMWTVQNLFWAFFLSSGFVHGNAWHFFTSNGKMFVITRTEKHKLKT